MTGGARAPRGATAAGRDERELMMKDRMRRAGWRGACLMVGACIAASAHAAGTQTVEIRFKGNYRVPSCKIVGGADQVVALPTISTTTLAQAGQTAGSTLFHFEVECESDVPSAIAYFQSGPTVDAETGNLIPQTDAGQTSATHVQIQLLNGDGSPIRVGDRSTIKPVPVKPGATVQLPYIAQYYATGRTTQGPISTYVTYTVEMY
jgi:major type 1 subunit fimbrin (pilin)